MTDTLTQGEMLLVVSIAGQAAALRAADVHSVMEVADLTPVPRAPDHVAGLSALRSRVLTVIDSARAMDLAVTAPRDAPSRDGPAQAVVLEHEGHFYALLVDEVDDVAVALSEPVPVAAGLSAGWHRACAGMVETARAPLPLLDAPVVIAGSVLVDCT